MIGRRRARQHRRRFLSRRADYRYFLIFTGRFRQTCFLEIISLSHWDELVILSSLVLAVLMTSQFLLAAAPPLPGGGRRHFFASTLVRIPQIRGMFTLTKQPQDVDRTGQAGAKIKVKCGISRNFAYN